MTVPADNPGVLPGKDLFSLHHIGIVTARRRYDDTVATIVACLGGVVEEQGEDEELDIQGTWLQVGSGLRLEVFAPRHRIESPITKYLSRSGGGLHHVSFETAEIGACRALAVAGGAAVIGESADHDGWAEHFLDPAQTGGALLHWMQALGREPNVPEAPQG
ncbi:VOC family protein [Amycolatopsis orientalis]|uniref:VOC family protein n=1 Tax=Amycolatopsis orientalis TaxID=31958 RepID=UPI0003A7D5BD|nr:VOC family protein [Amycolatopsis orientalis]